MKNKIYILLITFFVFQFGNAQSDFYYTFNNNKTNINNNPSKKILFFENGYVTNTMIPGELPGEQLTSNSFLIPSNKSLVNYSGYKIIPTYITSDGLEMYYFNEIVLKYKSNVSQAQKTNISNNLGVVLIKSTPSYDLYTTSGDALQVSKILYQTGNFEFCTPNFIAKTELFDHIPNDQYFGQQWYLHNTGQGTNDGKSTTIDADIDAPEAWDITKGNPNVVIAIIDEGVSSNHPDLPNSRQVRLNGSNFAYQYDGTNNQNDPSPTSSTTAGNNHGNSCAGLVGATQDNNEGISGVAPLCKIMPIKIPFGSVPASVYADAINFAVTNNADILSNSWGYGSSNPNLQPVIVSAINNAISNNKLVVFAAGNTANRVSGNNGYVSFPGNATIADLITVGASDRNNNQANYSPHGQTIEIVAPSHTAYNSQISGESFNIWTIDSPNTNQGYNSWKDSWAVLPAVGETLPNSGINFSSYTGRMGGTSAATPIVAGVLALMKSVNTCLTASQIKSILLNSTDKIGGFNYNWSSIMPGHSIELGYGKVNAHAAVLMAQSMGSATLDLMVKDSQDDTGAEPNTVTQYMWTSDNIWVRNNNDSGLTHENPDYSALGNPNYVKVRVINKSCVASTGNEQLKLYWAKASTALGYPNPWMGGVTHPTTGASMGSPIGTLTIPVIPAGGETILTFPWQVPNPANYGNDGDQWHFCLLTRIEATTDPMTFPETGDLNGNVRNNNNIAWKNVTVVDILPNNIVNPGGVVAVGNPFNHPKTFFLEMEVADLETGKPIYQEAEVGIKMDDVLYNAWERGGKEAQLLDPTAEEKRKIVKGNNVIVDNISFNANEIGTLRLDFNFLTKELTEKTNYVYHVIQKDAETGQVIGGETFVINKNPRPVFEAEAPDKEVDLNEAITISAEDINEPAIYNWYDNDGNLIYQGKDLQIANAVAEKFKLEVIATADGFKDYREVEVTLKPSTLENIAPNPATNNVLVSYKLNGASSAYLMIIGYYGSNGTSNNYILDVNSSETNLNVSNYPSGFYTVALVVNGGIVDAKTLIKQ